MKFTPAEKRYIDFETSTVNDIEILDAAEKILRKISNEMGTNSYLTADGYNSYMTKNNIIKATSILNLLVEYKNCFIDEWKSDK